jgi:hypothetical protein
LSGAGSLPPRRAIAAFAALGAAGALVGCPLPQPLPDYPEGQPITPPRIVVNDGARQIALPATVVRVPVGCATPPVYDVSAALRDANTLETFEARWFVNYEPTNQTTANPLRRDSIAAPATDATDPTLRATPAFSFRPYDHAPMAGTGGGDPRTAGAMHVLELVVSNGFDTSADTVTSNPLPPMPYRTPSAQFEIQLYRWVFVAVPEGGDVACPP